MLTNKGLKNAVYGDEIALTHAIFDESGQGLEEYRRRLVRERRRAWLRSWRPRFWLVVRIRLFPKTQDRLAAMERDLAAERLRVTRLERKVRELET